jgi:hypothetical protein
MSGSSFWRFAGWLPDSRHFVASGDDEIALVDVETGAWRGLGPNPAGAETYVTLSSDGQTLLVETPTGDGDIWMLERVEAQK